MVVVGLIFRHWGARGGWGIHRMSRFALGECFLYRTEQRKSGQSIEVVAGNSRRAGFACLRVEKGRWCWGDRGYRTREGGFVGWLVGWWT